ncbi:hypothetical protein Metev_0148 [Methanohalobium evestigatum Z-7303]|uniref:Uncharacterized protein n=1 Tax=Methanohalobium evestigatum (strain ATCC BAA-1072 / DSM 3721 / NBRC 107634 / OCM 161 / Z-7303) TaxID=644295 RepID=D7E657_METEZ|nr:hypothetical protein [Methanohalobium evestigatum]ADI73079.1 hypothetical protein Metev_0148 [Methanohalobium evestigatum Z-7303]
MKHVEDLPPFGNLGIYVYFENYTNNHPYKTQQLLDGTYPEYNELIDLIKSILNNVNLELKPKTYSLLRTMIGNRGRTFGASHTYKYNLNDNSELKQILNLVNEWFQNQNLYWIRDFDVVYCKNAQKRIDDLPLFGYLKVSIYFDGYGQYYQNETRKKLMGVEGESHKVRGLSDYVYNKTSPKNYTLTPKTFSLLRYTIGNKGRSFGAAHTYKYSVNNSKELEEIINKINEWFNNTGINWWDDLDIETCETIKW